MNCLSNISMTIFDMITYLILICGQCSQIRLAYCSNKVYAFCNSSNSYCFCCLQYVCIYNAAIFHVSLLLTFSVFLLLSLVITIRHLFAHPPPPPPTSFCLYPIPVTLLYIILHTLSTWLFSYFCLYLDGKNSNYRV